MTRDDDQFRDTDLAAIDPRHRSFVGVDSDGCVFDTMVAKQVRCFHPAIIAHWRLEPVGDTVRETAEFVGLNSTWRGSNRFIALLKIFELLASRPGIRRHGVELPDMTALREFVESGVPLGEPALEQAAHASGAPALVSALEWSRAVNRVIAREVNSAPPFPGARECLARMEADSDLICVSQTPREALTREWRTHGLDTLVRAIAGQEVGTKGEILALATRDKYASHNVLLIGDAPGDLSAAREAGALFYPILPGDEERSWERLLKESYPRFLAGDYAGEHQEYLIAGFEALLPTVPPWASGPTRYSS